MIGTRHFHRVAFAASTALVLLASAASAATCANTSAGFDAWKQQTAGEAKGRGVGGNGVAAILGASYNTATINADRGQRSFGLTLDQFMAKRGGATIISRGKSLKQSQAALFASIEQRTGVPPGPLLAIWGMETGFGAIRGNQNAFSAVATLAYDCRRTAFFTEHLYAALTLIDRGVSSAGARGSMHGEVGQTQFMPKAVLQFGGGANLETPSGALNATANFLKGNGWRGGAGYGPGEPNFAALQSWNAATVYQQAIAKIGKQIDGR